MSGKDPPPIKVKPRSAVIKTVDTVTPVAPDDKDASDKDTSDEDTSDEGDSNIIIKKITITKRPPAPPPPLSSHLHPFYKTYKHNLSKVIRDPEFIDIIHHAVVRTTRITTRTYLILRHYLLHRYHSKTFTMFNQTNVKNTSELQKMINNIMIMSCRKNKAGRKSEIDPNFADYFIKHHGNPYQLDKEHLSHILPYEVTEIITCYKNSIVANFFTILHHFINCSQLYTDDVETAENKWKRRSELKKVKIDMVKGSLGSDVKYHKWIDENRNNVLPANVSAKGHHYDLKANPLKYLKCMIYMCSQLETNKKSISQCIPLRTENQLKHVTLDTSALIELFAFERKRILQAYSDLNKEYIWNAIFQIKRKVGNSLDYCWFNREDRKIVETPLGTNDEKMEGEELKAHKKERDAKYAAERKVRNLNRIEEDTKDSKYPAFRCKNVSMPDDRKKLYKSIDLKYMFNFQISTDGVSANLLFIRSDQLIDDQYKYTNEVDPKASEFIEFPYIDDIDPAEFKHLKETTNFVYIDPGKRNLLFMMGHDETQLVDKYDYKKVLKDGHVDSDDPRNYTFIKDLSTKIQVPKEIFYNYTSKRRVHESHREIHVEMIDKLKKKTFEEFFKRTELKDRYIETKTIYGTTNIKEMETMLASYDKKTTVLANFEKYMEMKERFRPQLEDFYHQQMFLKYKRRRQIRTTQSESKLINEIKEKYEINGKKATLIIGDWNQKKQMKHHISTPCIGLKRLLAKHFKVLTLDEFRTSCLDNVSEERLENLLVPCGTTKKKDEKKKDEKKKDKKDKKKKEKDEKKNKKKSLKERKKEKKEFEKKLMEMSKGERRKARKEKAKEREQKEEDNKLAVKNAFKMSLKNDKRSSELEKSHAVLIRKETPLVSVCLSRDRNAVYNYKKIVDRYLLDGGRPINYKRSTEIPENSVSPVKNGVRRIRLSRFTVDNKKNKGDLCKK